MTVDLSTHFETCSAAQRRALLALRDLIHDVARTTEGVGPVEEALKWGQPSFLTSKTRSGTTIRLGQADGSDQVAIFVHCQTTLIEEFRQMFGDTLRFSGNRAILISSDSDLPEEALRYCIAQALTYHLRKKLKRTA